MPLKPHRFFLGNSYVTVIMAQFKEIRLAFGLLYRERQKEETMKRFLLTTTAALLLSQPALGKDFSSLCILDDDEAVAVIKTHDAEVTLDGKIRMYVYDRSGKRIAKHSIKTELSVDSFSEEKIFGAEVSKAAHHCEIDLKKVDVSLIHPKPETTVRHVYHYQSQSQPKYNFHINWEGHTHSRHCHHGATKRVYKYKSSGHRHGHHVQQTRIYTPHSSRTRKVTKYKVTL
jgi:hypothetical protein